MTATKTFRKLLDQETASFAPSLPSGILERLTTYFELSQKWGSIINITANLEPKLFLGENILDPLLAGLAFQTSPAYARLIEEASSVKTPAIDLGCGGGYVGIVWQLLFPNCFAMTLLDSDRKKINFCKQAIRELGLKDTQAIQARIEDFTKDNTELFSLSVSRATWPLEIFLPLTRSLLKKSGIACYFASAETLPTPSSNTTLTPYLIPLLGIERRLAIASF